MGHNNIGIKKCRTTFLWVLNFGEGVAPKIFNNTDTVNFFKISSQLHVPSGYF